VKKNSKKQNKPKMKKPILLVFLLVISNLKFNAVGCQNLVVNPNSIVLNASYLSSLGYNNQSTLVQLSENIVSIDPNTFNGYTQTITFFLVSNVLKEIDSEVFQGATSLQLLYWNCIKLRKIK